MKFKLFSLRLNGIEYMAQKQWKHYNLHHNSHWQHNKLLIDNVHYEWFSSSGQQPTLKHVWNEPYIIYSISSNLFVPVEQPSTNIEIKWDKLIKHKWRNRHSSGRAARVLLHFYIWKRMTNRIWIILESIIFSLNFQLINDWLRKSGVYFHTFIWCNYNYRSIVN